MNIKNIWSDIDLKSQKQNSRCLEVNTILAGKYLVGPVLGQGGFGITYLGYDLNMETKIAIKEYFPVELVSRDTTTMHGDRVLSLSGEKSVTYQQGLKKYVAEAQNVSQFSEVPGVVSVKDFFYENETAYIVMEYIDGISLKEYLKEKGGRLSEEETLSIMKPVLEALEKVHNAGIIHRDISPDNIMLTFEASDQTEDLVLGSGQKEVVSSGSSQATKSAQTAGSLQNTGSSQNTGSRKIKSVKLIDFGAARMTAKNDQKSLTIILKHGYAPEEQYRTHGEQGPWTDVYAVCAVMYRMLTGETPVPAMDRMFKDELKTFEDLKVNVSTNTASAILKGLAVKKEERIQSMHELMAVLYGGAKVKLPSGKPDKKKVYILGGICTAAVLVILVSLCVIFGMNKRNENMLVESEKQSQQDTAMEDDESIQESATEAEEQNTQGESEVTLDITEEEEDIIGEVIVTATPQSSLASSYDHIAVIKPDGTVEAIGSNEYDQLNVQDWSHMAAVAAGNTFTAGLREDGIVLIAGELETADEVELWTDIVGLTTDGRVLIGLKANGTLVSSDMFGHSGDYYEWSNIRAIDCSGAALTALTEDGQILIESAYSPDSTSLPKVINEISGWTDVEQIICEQHAIFGLTADGSVRYSTVFTDISSGSYNFSDMETFEDIVQLYSYAGLRQVGVRQDGTLCVGGISSVREDLPADLLAWDDMLGVMGLFYGEKYVGLKNDGTIVKTIKNYGNSTPEKMTNLQWVKTIEDMLVATTKDGRILTYGSNSKLKSVTEQSGIKQLNYLGGLEYNGYGYLTEDNMFYKDRTAGSLPWNNVKQLETEPDGQYCIGLLEDGTVKIQYSREQLDEYNAKLVAVEEWTGIQQIAVSGVKNSSRVYGLLEDGTVINMSGQEGVSQPQSDGTDIKAIFSGIGNVGAIKNDGTVVFFGQGQNDYGQQNVASWENIAQLALSASHTVGLREDGTVVAAGNNHAGQCEVEDWKDVVYVAVGANCTLGIQSNGTLLVAGTVGW